MLEFLLEFRQQFLAFLMFMTPVAAISFMTLGLVWAAGRLLGIVKTDRAKNVLAAFLIPCLSFLYQKSFSSFSFDLFWVTLELTTFSVIFYIAFCWKLYYRIDAFLNKKMGQANFKPTKKKRRKR